MCDEFNPVAVLPQWKELSTAIRQLHQTVINSTIVEAGGCSNVSTASDGSLEQPSCDISPSSGCPADSSCCSKQGNEQSSHHSNLNSQCCDNDHSSQSTVMNDSCSAPESSSSCSNKKYSNAAQAPTCDNSACNPGKKGCHPSPQNTCCNRVTDNNAAAAEKNNKNSQDDPVDYSSSRTHTVKISSPVFQGPSIDRIKQLVEE